MSSPLVPKMTSLPEVTWVVAPGTAKIVTVRLKQVGATVGTAPAEDGAIHPAMTVTAAPASSARSRERR